MISPLQVIAAKLRSSRIAMAPYGTPVKRQDLISTQFFIPPAPNEAYSACLAAKIDQMYQSRATPCPVQRTLLATGMLEACLNSRHHLNQRLETPHLTESYQPPAVSQYVRT
jgi:hypothetical protein